MPDVPCFFYSNALSPESVPSAWVKFGREKNPLVNCAPLVSSIFNNALSWEGRNDLSQINPGQLDNEIDLSALTITPVSPPVTTFGALWLSSYSYSDLNALYLGAIKTATVDGILRQTHFLSVCEVRRPKTSHNFVVSGSPPSSVSLDFVLETDKTYVNDALYHSGWDTVEFEIDGVTVSMTLTSALKQAGIVYRTVRTDTNYSSVSGTYVAVRNDLWEYSGSIAFAFTTNPIRVRLKNAYGEVLQWATFKLSPAGDFQVTSDDGEFSLNASGVYVLGGTIRAGNGFAYNNPVFTTDATVTAKSEDQVEVIEDTYTTNLVATSQAGCQTDFGNKAVTVEGAQIFGTFIDAMGVLHTAVNEDDGVRISRFPSGASSRELLALIPDAKGASYKYERATNVHLLSYQSRTTGEHVLTTSRDGGRNFS